MEVKGVRAVIMGLLILGLVVAQIEATTCCKNTDGRVIYSTCRFFGSSESFCASLSGCINVTGKCPSTYPHSNMLESSGDMINELCKVGCASSVCDTISTNQNSGEGEVSEAVEYCVNACSELCNKGAKTALASA
ncbi:Thionin [Thalictrum thalictroides]|uniref:Thionin n=1 Tax=Thalictrum thalictroides TaxID=46969 RepID=A0A7J6WZ82_THATH|nr:Thionin [Thalictrum thalictroides]